MYEKGPIRPGPHTGVGRVISTKKLVHIADLTAEPAHTQGDPLRMATTDILKARTFMAVPMLKDDELVGAIVIYRQEVRPFTDKQIELVQNFAAQAVIAIENTRLLNELRQRTDDLSESLEQQTATSEVLKVISSSPGELEPVFQAMLENATRVCDAKFGTLFRYDGEFFHRAAGTGTPPELVEFQKRRGPFKPEGSILRQVFQMKAVASTADERADPSPGPTAKLGGARSAVGVPMLKDNDLIGAIVIYRQEVRPFTDKQIELVKNFAAQAVIAIENTRLLNEFVKSLQQQTATADVLKVISRSDFDLQPVFDTMAESCVRLCEADSVTSSDSTASCSKWCPRTTHRGNHGMGHRTIRSARAAQRVGSRCPRTADHSIPDVLADPEYTYGAKQRGGDPDDARRSRCSRAKSCSGA